MGPYTPDYDILQYVDGYGNTLRDFDPQAYEELRTLALAQKRECENQEKARLLEKQDKRVCPTCKGTGTTKRVGELDYDKMMLIQTVQDLKAENHELKTLNANQATMIEEIGERFNDEVSAKTELARSRAERLAERIRELEQKSPDWSEIPL